MAARNVTLQFGLITIAAKAEGATIKAPEFANLCVGQPGSGDHAAAPIKAPKTCETCGPIVDYDALVKGVKHGKTFTLVDPNALAEAKESYAATAKGLINLVPHPAEGFLAHTVLGDTVHYLTPADTTGEDHYRLLAKLIGDHPELAFASLYTPVSATALYRVTTREGVLVLEKRVRGDAVKPVPSVGGTVNDALYAMLDGALSTFVTPYDPANYQDTYRDAVAKMLADGEQVTVGTAPVTPVPASADDNDLMAKLAALTKAA